jgi:aerobic carbon-monoxide dehydrogenase large subunit
MSNCSTVAEDVGRIVNPLTLHGQAMGGMVQGLGGAFLEHLVYDANGQLLSGNLADYLIPTTTDFPKVRAIALENHRSPSNPLGVKGAGEGAIISIGGLMANAVANALVSFGAMPNELPLSPALVWHMGSAEQSP